MGNETWGDWQVCQATQEAYAEKAYQWAKAIELVDLSIQVFSSFFGGKLARRTGIITYFGDVFGQRGPTILPEPSTAAG